MVLMLLVLLGEFCVWNKNVVKVICKAKFQYWILLHCCFSSLNFNTFIAMVYAPCAEADKKCLWKSIAYELVHLVDPILLIGDFNQVLHSSERSSSHLSSTRVRNFKLLIDSLSLLDLNLNGRKYTWRNSSFCSRIDRALVSNY